jgi:hypothetical protein
MYIAFTDSIQDVSNLTASEEVATFEVEMIQDPLGTSVWRSTGVTPFIVGQFAETLTPSFWGSFYTNAKSGDEERLRLADTEAELTSGPSLDTGDLSVWPGTGDLSDWPYAHSRHVISSPVSADWFRIDYDFTGNSDGFVQVGALSIDDRFAPVNGHVTPWQMNPRSSAVFSSLLADGSESRGGGSHKIDGRYQILGLTQAEWTVLRKKLRSSNSVLPAMTVLDENEDTYPMEYMFYGYTTAPTMFDQKSHFPVNITVREP